MAEPRWRVLAQLTAEVMREQGVTSVRWDRCGKVFPPVVVRAKAAGVLRDRRGEYWAFPIVARALDRAALLFVREIVRGKRTTFDGEHTYACKVRQWTRREAA